MNVNRFSARTARDALALVRQSLGEDAVVLSTKPCAEGVEVLAMAHDGLGDIERLSTTGVPAATSRTTALAHTRRSGARAQSEQSGAYSAADSRDQPHPAAYSDVADDVEKLSMSTLSFQDYVRERMLRRRQAALEASESTTNTASSPRVDAPITQASAQTMNRPSAQVNPLDVLAEQSDHAPRQESSVVPMQARQKPFPHDERSALAVVGNAPMSIDHQEMLDELRSVKGLIEERFGALAFIEKLQRRPVQARTAHRLLDCGFTAALTRKLTESLPSDATDDLIWAGEVLEKNLLTDERESALEDQGGVFALIGPTGVGKTTGAAKIAAAFTAKYGAASLGLITLDAYRLAAHEQLRAFGRILGVAVHTAHDRDSLEDLLDLLSAKKMILIDTAGMAQRDTRTRELLDMVAHPSIKRLLVVNSAAQGETTEDVVISYRVANCVGVALSKMDEAVKLAPVLDVLIRHKLKVVGVANGQRVPEDWHRLSSHALVQHALQFTGSGAYRMDADEVNLIFTAANSRAAAVVAG